VTGFAVVAGHEATDVVDVSVVMPAYEEGAAIEPVLRALGRALTGACEILVVVDSPADSTVPVIERLGREIPSLRAVLNRRGGGVLGALRTGMEEARGAWVLVTMADGSDDYAALPRMLALARDGADVVAASRYMRGGRQIGGPRVKGLMSRAAGLTLCWFAGVPTHDATNNFKIYSRRLLDGVAIESSAGFEIALELTVKAAAAGYRIVEVPAKWRDRAQGTSRFRLRRWLPHYLHWYGYAFRARLRRAAVPGR
jgi:glycosyltransferase involved in cell wall biosynthesis